MHAQIFWQKLRYLFFLAIISFVVAGCGGGSSSSPKGSADSDKQEAPSYRAISVASQTIGESGGTLEAAGVSLNIKEGSFDSNYKLQLNKLEELEPVSDEFLNDAISDLYVIEGLPQNSKHDLSISLPVRASASCRV
ncbi:hypothetical protein [Desulfurispira natronophila]|uniref:Uncharacterized protein n=1 Tax=Desulfurispira natronophila TaxID=682562 RepID=A0A7W8DGV0_9BACT|nr:hypothetical protein [Desulfurispira natronophila]MBB5021901.1 hypothetical protein [Desulfurispira natronophila]